MASIEDDVGNIVLYGNEVTRGHEGDFLIMDGHIWLIDQVTPEDQQTTVTVVDVRNVFDRKLPYIAEGTTIGSWLAEQLENHYKSVSDAVYAICVSESIQTMRVFVNMVYKTIPGIMSINAHSVLDIIKGSIIPE